jgi:hypothetical protein
MNFNELIKKFRVRIKELNLETGISKTKSKRSEEKITVIPNKFSQNGNALRKGIELGIYDENKNHFGDVVITNAGLILCYGKTPAWNGNLVTWDQLFKKKQNN